VCHPSAFLNEYRSKVIIDEVQRVPDILSYIQAIVDEDAENRQFILTSARCLTGSVVYNGAQTRETKCYKLIPYRQLSKFIDPAPA